MVPNSTAYLAVRGRRLRGSHPRIIVVTVIDGDKWLTWRSQGRLRGRSVPRVGTTNCTMLSVPMRACWIVFAVTET